ncbi:hypothetical protein CCACVL1_27265, partial [Corchorus capsularis]
MGLWTLERGLGLSFYNGWALRVWFCW